jgi:hypothetical protein
VQLILLKETIQYSNEASSIEPCFSQINQLLNGNDYVLSHLEIDGVDVYENHLDYISDRILNIQVIVVIVNTFKQTLDESIINLEAYLTRAIPVTIALADEFYKGSDKESWNKLGQLFEGLQWVMQALEPVYTMRNNELVYKNSLQYSVLSSELTDQILELEKALSHSDMVLVADLIKYEILDILQRLRAEIQITIDNEVVRHDLN